MPNHRSEYDFIFKWMGDKEQLSKMLGQDKPQKTEKITEGFCKLHECGCNNYPDTKSAKIAGEIERLVLRIQQTDDEIADLIKHTAIVISKIN